MNSLGDAISFPFRDPGWAGKIVVQALILIIPIVGVIAAGRTQTSPQPTNQIRVVLNWFEELKTRVPTK